MNHPFQVGGKYRNRIGEYEVIKLEEPKMVIRYADGRVVKADIEILARIWRNIQADENQPHPPHPSPPSGGSRPSRDHRGKDFTGLVETDFKKGVGGTSWRARANLGGLLARIMSSATGRYFESYAIYRRAEVHIVEPLHYVGKRRWREPKFFFSLSEEGADYGFYIEKNNGPMDETWRWKAFVSALQNDTDLQQKVQAAMLQWQLRWDVYVWADGGLIARVAPAGDGLRWEQAGQERPKILTWPQFTGRLSELDPGKWCDLQLCSHMPKKAAIEAGSGIAARVIKVYCALLPLYDASCRRQ